jgi:hypothetical protein
MLACGMLESETMATRNVLPIARCVLDLSRCDKADTNAGAGGLGRLTLR